MNKMLNQNRRPGELEIRLEAPQASEALNPVGNYQFLIVRDVDDMEPPKRKGVRNSVKGKCQTVRAYIPNEPLEVPLTGTCKTISGYSMPEIKPTETNASHASKMKGDYSEDCENTQSSQVSMSTGVEDSSEVDSRMTSKGSRQPCYRRSSRTTIHSSQNGQIDESDQRCTLSGREQVGDGAQQSPKEEIAFPVECFTQLYKRIEALEELLQRGLESFKKEPCKCKEKCKSQKTPQPNKVQFAPPEKPRPPMGCELLKLPEFMQEVIDSSRSTAPVASVSEGKESMDTDNELQNIKKRVIALEEKLKRLKLYSTQQSNTNERNESNNTMARIKIEKNQGQTMTEKHNDSTAQTHSEAESFQRSDIFFLNADLKESVGWKIKNKVNKKIFTKCKTIRRDCSSALGPKKIHQYRNGSLTIWNCLSEQSATRTRSLESTLCRYPYSNDSDKNKKLGAAVVYRKCQNASEAFPNERYSDRKRQKVKDLCRKAPVTNLVMSQFTERDNEVEDPHAFGDCKFLSSPRKRRRSKRRPKRYLVSRHSPMGVHSFHRRHTAYAAAKRSSRHLAEFSHRRPKSRNRDRESKKRHPRRTCHPATKEIANGEDKIKIPVLFEEQYKPMKPVHKISNFSMRFVLVENDPNNPLKNLIDKLSKGKSRKEQYMFGVSKCSCEESRYAAPKICRRGGSSKPVEAGLIHSILGAGQKLPRGLLRFRPEDLYI